MQDQIKQLNIRLKESDSRSEYAEMNITKLHLRWDPPVTLSLTVIAIVIGIIIPPAKLILLPRIDELEDEIIREKLKINAVSGQLDDTFNEMLNKY